MKLKELMRFRQIEGSGSVPDEVLRQLELPVPDDVLEQFVRDHGTKTEFQEQYGELDLHAIQWSLETVTAREFLAATIYRHFDWQETVARRTRLVARDGWSDVVLPPGAAEHWQAHGTWTRPPVTLRGALVRSESTLHLVEGHTRFGALYGLVECGVLSEDSLHQIWIGEAYRTPHSDGPWRDVVRREGVTFLDWLMRHVDDEGDMWSIAERLITAKHRSISRYRFRGHDLAAVLEFAERDTRLAPLRDCILKAHERWAAYVSP